MLKQEILERFGGISRLYGEPALEKFTKSHVAIIGIGGVGSWAVEALARSGIGKITMIDLDEICITNINRQLHATVTNIGAQKTTAMAERVRAINPDCEIIIEHRFYSEKNSESILSQKFDYIIDAIDQLWSKAHLIAQCKQLGVPLVVCGGTGGLKDATKLQIDDVVKVHNDPLIKKVRNILRSHYHFPKANNYDAKKFGVECIFSSESPVYPTCDGNVSTQRDAAQKSKLNCTVGFGSATHMTATVGLYAVQQCLKQLSK